MQFRDKLILNLLIIIPALIIFYLIKPILFPFVAAIIIAYFFNPLADRITRFGLSRLSATLIILALAILFAILAALLIVPLLYNQATNFAAATPRYVDVLVNSFYPQMFEFLTENGVPLESDFRQYFDGQNVSKIFDFFGGVLGNVMKSGMFVVNIVSLLVITPILVFYMIRDWNLMIGKIDNHLPTKHKKEMVGLFSNINETLASCIQGQLNVCLILGIFYGTALHLSGLDFGFLIGILTGFFSFIPYIGMLIGVAIAVVIALFQWGTDFSQIGIVVVIFFVGQIFEGNFLTPNLVGDRIGLHPVWIIFGLFFFGILFGFVGILLALPLTAICGVLIKFAIRKYKEKFVEVDSVD
ncbi:MAG: putative PurR-regulated permease PerM [Lentimonas sp.]|jgi:predicted PurR-regulated permease PerM